MGAMKRRSKMCEGCPFRHPDKELLSVGARVAPEDFPCHEEQGPAMDQTDIQCRGHWEARRKAQNDKATKENATCH